MCRRMNKLAGRSGKRQTLLFRMSRALRVPLQFRISEVPETSQKELRELVLRDRDS